MTVNFLDLRGQPDLASTIESHSNEDNEKAIIFIRVSSCEFIKKTCISYVSKMQGRYNIYCEVLDKFQSEKQGFKNLIYKAVINLKRIGAKDIIMVLVNPDVYGIYERNYNQGKSSLNYEGSFILIEDKEELAMNYFLEYLSELYRNYIPPNGYKLRTDNLEEALRWLQFMQGEKNFENHIEVPITREGISIYVEITYNHKSVLIRYGLLCWLIFDWLMRQGESKNKKVELSHLVELGGNYLNYFGKIDTVSIRSNKMGLNSLSLSKQEKSQLLNRLIDFDDKEKFNLLAQNVQFYTAKNEKPLDFNQLASQCSETYRYHLALVKFKSEEFESNNIECGEEALNLYHAIANWKFPDIKGKIAKKIIEKTSEMNIRSLALYSLLLGETIDIEQAWKLEIAIVVQQAEMLISGMDYVFQIEKSFDSEELRITNNTTEKHVKIPLNDIEQLLKKHHENRVTSPISLSDILSYKN